VLSTWGVRMMRRDLIVNWNEIHDNIKSAIDKDIRHPLEVSELEPKKGWSYVTFFRPGTRSDTVLFDVDKLELLATSNGFFLPRHVISQHNKIMVTAYCDAAANGSAQVFGLYKFLEAYAAKYSDMGKYPNHGFYGKLGGIYERPEKGRVLAIYATSDDALLDILSSVEQLVDTFKVKGIRFEYRLTNGLSAIPRILHGFDDPQYRQAGADIYRISDPTQFSVLLEQARNDYSKYIFDKPPEI
jgi:hypothetical protein